MAEVVSLISMFVSAFGGPLGTKIFRVLSGTSYREELSKILKLVSQSTPLQEAMKKVLGDGYDALIAKAKNTNSFVFESDEGDYHSIAIDKKLPLDKRLELIRSEFNLNIRDLQLRSKEEEIQSYAITIMKKWIDKYQQVIGFKDKSEMDSLAAISKILDPDTKTFKDLYNLLRPYFGVSSILSIIYAVMLFSGIGLGVVANISLSWFGVPGVQIVSFVLLSTILAHLATMKLGTDSKIQAVIQSVYKFLDGMEVPIKVENLVFTKQRMDEFDELMEISELNENIDSESLLSIVGILKKVVEVDGESDESEIVTCKSFLQREFAFTDENMSKFWDSCPCIENFSSLSELKKVLTLEQRNRIFETVKKVIVADDHIHGDERKLAVDLKKVFGL